MDNNRKITARSRASRPTRSAERGMRNSSNNERGTRRGCRANEIPFAKNFLSIGPGNNQNSSDKCQNRWGERTREPSGCGKMRLASTLAPPDTIDEMPFRRLPPRKEGVNILFFKEVG